MEKMKKIMVCLALALALLTGIGVSSEAANSYSMKHKKTVTIVNKKSKGKGKKFYFTFTVRKRSYVQLSVHQEYKDDEVTGLKAKKISDTQLKLQVKKGGKWKDVAKKQTWASDLYGDEVMDDNDNLIPPYLRYIADGDGGYRAGLEKGNYRYVLTTGYPEAQVTLKIRQFSKPGLTRNKAKKMNRPGTTEGKLEGIFTSKDTKPQWYRFDVQRKQKMQIGLSYLEDNSKKPSLTVYMYQKNGKLLWKGSSLLGEPNKKLVLKKGTYYFKVQPNVQNGNGVSFILYTYPVVKD